MVRSGAPPISVISPMHGTLRSASDAWVDAITSVALPSDTRSATSAPPSQGSYLCMALGRVAISTGMKRIEPMSSDEDQSAAADLASRLARYRRRVEAEGRPRSVRLIDKAIEEAGREGGAG